jgi:hypothetical protein
LYRDIILGRKPWREEGVVEIIERITQTLLMEKTRSLPLMRKRRLWLKRDSRTQKFLHGQSKLL